MREAADAADGAAAGGLVLVHSSDLHVDDAGPHAAPSRRPGGLAGLAAVLALARGSQADLVLLAGDTFDNARVSPAVLAEALALLAAAGRPVLMLPGNHDALLPDCLFRRAGLSDLDHVTVLGVTHEGPVRFEALGLEVWGAPHRGGADFSPLGTPPPRRTRWQVAMAHGHYVPEGEWRWQEHRAWRISDAALAAAAADYVALGHWDRAARVGPAGVEAHYSGSPELAGTVNLVTLAADGVTVRREPLRPEDREP